MKKLFWSAFAVSLCLVPLGIRSQVETDEDFIGLEKEIMPELEGPQKFSPRNLHQNPEMVVKETQVEIDHKPLRGQKYSLIPWETQDPQEWLSIDRWLDERAFKDKTTDWKFRLRDEVQSELMGKVLHCHGTCEIYRGTNKAKGSHLSRLNEGDEFKTAGQSVAWIYLMDGSLLRVGPESSVSLNEINWSKTEVLLLVRLNQGHVYWHPRDTKNLELNLSPETDVLSLPVMVRDANLAHFERKLFQEQKDFERSSEVLKLEETSITRQIKTLNDLRETHQNLAFPVSRMMMIAPNISLVAKLASFDLIHYPGGKAYFKKRQSQEGHDLSLHLRGYTSAESTTLTDDGWHEAEVNGRSFSKVSEVSGALDLTELLTRRIKTIELAREIWIRDFTVPIIKSLENPKSMALDFGYSIWEEKLSKRFDFLVEYTRRMETTNLKSMDNLIKKMEAAGKQTQKELDDNHYKTALNFYLRELKTRYTDSRFQIREMNDLQYYIWILRNGKK